MKDTITPVIVGFISVIINVILNIIFLKATNLSVGGLSLATSITVIINMIVLILLLNKKVNGFNLKKVTIAFLKTVLSSAVMGITIYMISQYVHFNIDTKIGQLFEVATLISVGVFVFGIISMLLKMEEIDYLVGIIKSKLKFS